MCVDFTDLNKACPKDAYPLPNIDKLVDNASGFKSLSFMDVYSGYNQILMHPEDQNKTAFITEHGNFCYRVMPFGLKNAGATYQRLMDKVFRHQIGRNMEIYVDDMVAKTTQEKSHCDDLKEIFEQIRAYNMRLNPEKCAFGVQGGKFLGFILTSRGIEANPEKYFISELTPDELNKHWELHVHGASSRGGSGAGIILKEGDKVVAEQSLQFHFSASNNQAEYEALIVGLKLALNLQAKILTAHCDSLLVVQQIRGEFQVKDPLLERYWLLAKDLISKFGSFIILHVHREKNVRAGILSKFSATRADTQTSALSQVTLKKPSIELLSITSINHLRDWRTPFLEYINVGIIPRDELNPQHFRRKASLYTNIAGELYKRGFSQPLLKCLNKDEAQEVMDEVHEGVCGNHIGGRVLAAKIARTGMEVSWPFHRWGLDILGPFPIALGQAIKKKLDNTKGEWAELIPEVLWSYNTTIQTTTGETPFKLVYGSEALIPVEVGIPTLRADLYDEQYNIDLRNAELDLAEEDREITVIKQRAQKQLVERRHNKKVVPRTFEEGDLVLRRTEEARRPPSHGNSPQIGKDHSEYPEYSEWGLPATNITRKSNFRKLEYFFPKVV
ncbi:uncharacterized protein [Arachis hypogaea]|uniref:uncharacterized protein n=1 Tax=Arachis hypogaea TaxID=3818 RepID=UPI003B215E8A